VEAENMRKRIIVYICATLLISLPFTSLAMSPKPLASESQKIVSTPNGDPDGPYAGGLDDPTDWINFFFGIGWSGFVFGMIVMIVSAEEAGVLTVFGLSLYTFYFVINGLLSFGEAFDFLEKPLERDGF
jgi:hypothetical protein